MEGEKANVDQRKQGWKKLMKYKQQEDYKMAIWNVEQNVGRK